MPKTEIDYSNTIIYKITCKDPTIKDVYVGHTTNFVQRKHSHKQCCINPNYKCKLYETIRNNGGWTNWTMEIINFFNCRDHYEARIKEQEYFVLLNATLNSIEPLPKPKEVISQNTFIQEPAATNIDKSKYIKKIICKQHPNTSNNAKLYTCEKCAFTCSKQSNYNEHIMTRKHKMMQKDTSVAFEKKYKCHCGSTYKYSSGYYRHKKTCINDDILVEPITQEPVHVVSKDTETNWVEIIQMLIKENQEIRNAMFIQTNTMIEQQKALTEQNKTLMDFIKNQQLSNTN